LTLILNKLQVNTRNEIWYFGRQDQNNKI
jgi:hypothetical protein